MNKNLKIVLYIFGSLGIILVALIIISYILGKISDRKFDEELMEEYSEIEYSVPDSFEKTGKYHAYSYYGDNTNCRLNINSSKIYEEDFEKWFKGSIFLDLNDEIGELSKRDLNGSEAFYVEVSNNNGIEHHYGIRSSNYYYHIEYDYGSISSYNEEGICRSGEDTLLSSLKVK